MFLPVLAGFVIPVGALLWLLALVAGDLPALAERFALDETLAADGSWRLVLTPDEADERP